MVQGETVFFSQKSSDVFQDESYGKNKQTKCHAGNNCAIVSQLGYIWIWSGARDQQSTNQCAHFVVWKSSDITIVNIFHTLWKNEVLRESNCPAQDHNTMISAWPDFTISPTHHISNLLLSEVINGWFLVVAEYTKTKITPGSCYLHCDSNQTYSLRTTV